MTRPIQYTAVILNGPKIKKKFVSNNYNLLLLKGKMGWYDRSQ